MGITWSRQGTVAVVVMDDGENRHNPAFVEAFLKVLDEVEADREVGAVVVASTDPKNWSQGIDLAWIMGAFQDPAQHDAIRGFLRGLNRVFARILTYPMPVIAAIGGHCFGDGAILACACDFRFMRRDRGFFCFPEVDVNIPFMPGMLEVVRKAFPEPAIDALYLTGKRVGGADLLAMGLVTGAPEGAEATVAEAVALGATFRKQRSNFAEMKRRKHQRILGTFDRDDEPIIQGLRVLG